MTDQDFGVCRERIIQSVERIKNERQLVRLYIVLMAMLGEMEEA